MTTLYHFDATTREHLDTTEARRDPIENKPMIPANATAIKPPTLKENQVAIWNGSGWDIEADHRGAVYWGADQERHVIAAIGEALPDDAILQAPSDPRQSWDGTAWGLGLDDQKADALAVARATAGDIRRQIAGAANIERALGWVLKAVFAGIGQINDQAPNPLLKPLADVAAQGFAIETELTGEDATAIRDRSVENAGAFFLALQLVEGMERVAENQIEEAETIEALEATITQLRALEAQALEQLSQMMG